MKAIEKQYRLQYKHCLLSAYKCISLYLGIAWNKCMAAGLKGPTKIRDDGHGKNNFQFERVYKGFF